MDSRKLFFIMLVAMLTIGTVRVNAVTTFSQMLTVAPVDSVSNNVYELPQFPGGDEACMKWLRDHIKYPGICREQGIQGRVVVSFVVNRDGSIVDAKIMRTPDQHLSDEALRVVYAMPKWKPARQGNKTVRTCFLLTMDFKSEGRITVEPLKITEEEALINMHDPRGIYKMTAVRYTDSEGNDALTDAPTDQYKICTDNITLTLRVIDGKLSIVQLDDVFNFTGDNNENENDTTAQIFDSNEHHFTLKWFSHETRISHFPYRTWCYEYYKSGEFSPEAKQYFDILETIPQPDKKNPFIGTWVKIGKLDELNNAKKNVALLYARYKMEGRPFDIYTFMPEFAICSNSVRTSVYEIEYKKKNRITDWLNCEVEVKWITDDCFALSDIDEFGQKDWEIYYRKTDSTPLQDVINVRTYWSTRPWRIR